MKKVLSCLRANPKNLLLIGLPLAITGIRFFAVGQSLNSNFYPFELLALVAGVLIAALVSADGESNWLEGVELIAVYVVLGLAFFLFTS